METKKIENEKFDLSLFSDEELIKELRTELLKSRIMWALKEKFKDKKILSGCGI